MKPTRRTMIWPISSFQKYWETHSHLHDHLRGILAEAMVTMTNRLQCARPDVLFPWVMCSGSSLYVELTLIGDAVADDLWAAMLDDFETSTLAGLESLEHWLRSQEKKRWEGREMAGTAMNFLEEVTLAG